MTRRRGVGRRGRRPARAGRLLRAGLHARRQDLGAAPGEGRGVDREENLAMIADSVAFLVARGQARGLRRRALLRRLPRRPRLRAASACGRRPTQAPRRSSLCDTNGASLPPRSPRRPPRCVAARRRSRARRRSTPTTTPSAPWPTRSPPSRPGATPGPGHDQRLRRALRQRQPRLDRRQPAAQAGHRVLAASSSSA